MTSTTVIVVLLIASVGAWLAWDLSRATRVWRRLRGARVVTCPETGRAAGVQIDVRHAVATTLLGRRPEVRLANCSRWAVRGRCTEPCIHDAQNERLTTKSIIERWFAGKTCVYCHKPIGDPHFLDHYAAVLMPDGITVEWIDVPAEGLWAALRTSLPVCWNCHIAETFRRMYPDLVTDRPWPRNPA